MYVVVSAAVPVGVAVDKDGVLYDEATGNPLPRDLKLSMDGRKILAGPNSTALPKCELCANNNNEFYNNIIMIHNTI